jgi:predicted negative regulator of RcsB-dependent stress response
VLWVSGDKDQARKVWEEALQEHPDSEPLREVMQRFTP